MSPFRPRLAAAFLLVLGSAIFFAGDSAQGACAQGVSWEELLRRNQRVEFTRRSGHDARVELLVEEPPGGPAPGEESSGQPLAGAERGAAILAMGCTQPQMVRERPFLESLAKAGDLEDRCAALLALGEFGEGADAALLAHLSDPEAEVRGSAMLGLLLTGRRSSRERVQAIADGNDPDAELASRLLVQVIDPQVSQATSVGARYLKLRWMAGRRYGLVDGHSWMTRVLGGLIAEPLFLDAVVLGSVARSKTFGVKDHLLAQLVARSGTAEMKAAAIAMPDELAALIQSNLWKPADAKAWRVLLDEVELQRTENTALGLLALAIEVPEVEIQALMLLASAGLSEPLIGLDEQWSELDSDDRIRAARAWALAEDARAIDWLAGFAEDPDPAVRAAILTARARLGDRSAHDALRAVLVNPEHEDFSTLLAAAAQQAAHPLPRGYLENLLPVLKGDKLLLAATALARNGVTAGRKALSSALSDGFPAGRAGAACVHALAGRAASAEISVLRQHFPVENDFELNVALALAIVDAHNDLSLQFLRPALWLEPFDRSVLAALVIVQVSGMHGLRDELTNAPLDVSSRDLRRVGFAVGEWGGIQAVEFFQKKWGLLSSDPIFQGALMGALGRRTH